ncbi:MAG: dihydroorotate dehydrogenase electron transfer subunit [Bacteroidia bacterium]|nr:dihydroorotate dehydrogenase electron transfer subunit [Bacteroidia bacterium]
MRKSVQNMKVVANLRLNDDHYLLQLNAPDQLENIYPGQFANIQVDQSQSVFLRRPFSIHTIDYQKNTISILIKEIGEGTRTLSHTPIDSYLSVIFPLGNGFTLPASKENVLLVGGGCGVAPLLHLAQVLNRDLNDVNILLGGRSEIDLVELDQYAKYGKIYTTTEDGSYGEKGFVTDHSIFSIELDQFTRIYCCGPEPMMKAVATKAKTKSVFCEVSLENTMACGFGVCLCCVTETIQGHKCVCTDGPVFNINQLKWQI